MLGRALIADDDESYAHRMAEYAQHHGFEVTAAAKAADVLDLIQRIYFDVIVVEPNLPGASWYSFLLAFPCSIVPNAICVTSYYSTALAKHTRELGFLSVLRKPVAPTTVFAVLGGSQQLEPLSSPARASMPLAAVEWEHINDTLRDCQGNVSEASRRLLVPRQTLYRKLRKHPRF